MLCVGWRSLAHAYQSLAHLQYNRIHNGLVVFFLFVESASCARLHASIGKCIFLSLLISDTFFFSFLFLCSIYFCLVFGLVKCCATKNHKRLETKGENWALRAVCERLRCVTEMVWVRRRVFVCVSHSLAHTRTGAQIRGLGQQIFTEIIIIMHGHGESWIWFVSYTHVRALLAFLCRSKISLFWHLYVRAWETIAQRNREQNEEEEEEKKNVQKMSTVD